VNPRTTTFTEAMIQRLRELGHVEGPEPRHRVQERRRRCYSASRPRR
jgi:hypothetical protein